MAWVPGQVEGASIAEKEAYILSLAHQLKDILCTYYGMNSRESGVHIGSPEALVDDM